MLGVIDRDLKPYSPQIYLAKPNREIIASLKEAYDLVMYFKFGGIHEVDFKIPYTVIRHHRAIKNDHVDKLRGHFLLKIDNDWYVISEAKPVSSGGKKYLEVKAFLLPYELRSKRIPIYEKTQTAFGVMSDCLSSTTWKVGYIDADFNLTYRTFEVAEKTVLDFLYDIAETFNGVLLFDTEDKKVHLYKYENLGLNKGLQIRYGKYLKNITKEPNFNEVCTRLYVYGKDGRSIHSVNPAGTGFIECFDYYMYPYDETIISDNEYIVNSHSAYMSDELCHAILKYQRLLNEKTPTFNNLLTQKTKQQRDLVKLENELDSLNVDLEVILDNLDIFHSALENNNKSNDELVRQRNNKRSEIRLKEDEIKDKKAEIKRTDSEIESLKRQLLVENNFSPELLKERDYFIFEKKWSNEYYTDPNELLDRAKEEIVKLCQPQIHITVDIVDFLKVVECQKDWDKLKLGDIVCVKYDDFNIDIHAKIIGIKYEFDRNRISLEIANDKDIKDGFYSLKDIIKNNISTSTTIDFNKYKWNIGEEAGGLVHDIINNKINANKNAVEAGMNENYTFDRRGITLRDPDDPLNYLRILHNILAFTNDGGNTFKHAITPTGIVGEYIYGRIIFSERLILSDDDSILNITGSVFTVSDYDGNAILKLGKYDTDKYGLKLFSENNTLILNRDEGLRISKRVGSSWRDVTWLDLNGILNTEGVIANKLTIDNDAITLDPNTGLTVNRNDGRVKIKLNANEGISIERLQSGTWTKKFYVDTYGVLHAEDLIAKRLILTDGKDKVILDADSKFLDLNQFDEILGQLPAENIFANTITADEGFIADLTVNRLKTLDMTAESRPVNYIDIQGHYARWIHGIPTGTTQAVNRNGEKLYWTDESRTSTTTENTGIPCIVYDYEEHVKLQIYFNDRSADNIPIIQLGEGNGIGNEAKGFIRKESDSLNLEYVTQLARGVNSVNLHDTGISTYAFNGLINTLSKSVSTGVVSGSFVDINEAGDIKLDHNSGSSIEIKDNNIKLSHESGSYIEFLDNGDIKIVSAGNLYLN